MFEQMKGIAQLSGTQKNEAAKLIVDQHRDAEATRHNRAQEAVEWGRIAAEKAKAATKEGKTGKIPENMVPKVAALAESPDIYNQLEKAHNNIGPSALTGFLPPALQFGAQKDYTNLIKANAGPGSLAAYPAAKSESAELMKSFEDALPTGRLSDEKAHAIFDTLRNRANAQFTNTADTLEAGGTSPSELAQLRQTHEAAQRRTPVGRTQEGAAPAAPAGGGWDAAKEARLQELRRKAASK
jgi:hypothetical protein